MRARVGIDIGGTFTDGVAFDTASGAIAIEKMLTTPADLSHSFLEVFDSLLERLGADPEEVVEILHASTIATNALLQRRGATVGLLVTEGFRDILEIGRQVRSELYDLFTRKPEPLVPRARVHEIHERIDHRGDVVVPIDLDGVESAIRALRDAGVDSIAICFLHSYRNPTHELLAEELIRDRFSEIFLSVSSRIAPEIKEYWRASTTSVNAFVGPVVRRYLDRIQSGLRARGYENAIGIMHSGGGIESLRSISHRPFQMIESGPAAGVAGAAHFASTLGFQNGLTFDMGGTTAKAGLILRGVSRVLPEFEVAAERGSGASLAKASGYPILGEVVDLVEVGAGGGSLAWIDDGGHLRVGPHGAGSDPGPASYALGGEQATITDANLLLGRLNPEYFLGGRMALDRDAAERALESIAQPLGLSTVEAARGVVAVANARMVGALRLVSVERGHDPREFCLVAFGGAGPLHAASIASELGIPDVLIPPNPGVASAWGLLLSDIRHDVRQTVLRRLDSSQISTLRDAFVALDDRLRASLGNEDVEAVEFEFSRYIEARYEGQSARLRIEWTNEPSDRELIAALADRLHAEHKREFGYQVAEEPIQILTAGITATLGGEHARVAPQQRDDSPAVPKDHRDVIFDNGVASCVPVYDRASLPDQVRISGPAVIEEFDSTTLVPSSFTFAAVDGGVIHMRRENA